MTHDLGYLIGGSWLLFIALVCCLPWLFTLGRPARKRMKVRRHD